MSVCVRINDEFTQTRTWVGRTRSWLDARGDEEMGLMPEELSSDPTFGIDIRDRIGRWIKKVLGTWMDDSVCDEVKTRRVPG